jgi:hypothetical protein
MEYTSIIKAHNVTCSQAELQFELGLISHVVKKA